MDRAIHTPSACQGGIGCIADGGDLLLGDVPLNNFQGRLVNASPSWFTSAPSPIRMVDTYQKELTSSIAEVKVLASTSEGVKLLEDEPRTATGGIYQNSVGCGH